MIEFKHVILLFLIIYVKGELLQDINVSNDWTYINDKSHKKIEPIFAPSNDHLKLTYAICNYVNETRTEVKCKITVEIEKFTNSQEAIKEECVLHFHSGDDYLIDKDTIKLHLLDTSGYVLIHREDVSLNEVYTSEKTVTFARNLKVRTIKMVDCSSRNSDIVLKLDNPRSKYYVAPELHSFDITIKKESPNGSYYSTSYCNRDGHYFSLDDKITKFREDEQTGKLVKLIDSPRSDEYFGVYYRESDKSIRVGYKPGEWMFSRMRMLIQNYDNHVIKYDYDIGERKRYPRKYLLICASNSTKINCLFNERYNIIDNRTIDVSGYLNQVIIKGPEKYVLWTNTNEFDKLTIVDVSRNRTKTKTFPYEKDDGARRFFGNPDIEEFSLRVSNSEEATRMIDESSVTVCQVSYSQSYGNASDEKTLKLSRKSACY